jgi:hypothetical protein
MKIKKNLIVLVGVIVVLSLGVLAVTLINSPNTCSGQWSRCDNAFENDIRHSTAE